MSIPQSSRGWLCWGVSVADRYEAPHSPRYEYTGRSDPRADDRRESSISVKMLAERASHGVCGNGVGYALMMRFYAGEASWHSFTLNEQWILERTIRRFRRELQEAGFLPREGNEITP